MKFWLPKIIFGFFLVILAILLLENQELILSALKKAEPESRAEVIDDSMPVMNIPRQDNSKPNITKAVNKKSTNAAAEGLSSFYASINADMNKKGLRIKKNIVYLPDPKGDIDKILEARRLVTRPLRANWEGDKISRPFRVGQTLFQKLSEYAGNNGLEVIWWLNRDFLIKDPFRINKNILETAYQVGKAVGGHFENGISTFFCYQQRTIVLTDMPTDYMKKECTLLRSKSGYD